jgi:hypothetical protein
MCTNITPVTLFVVNLLTFMSKSGKIEPSKRTIAGWRGRRELCFCIMAESFMVLEH